MLFSCKKYCGILFTDQTEYYLISILNVTLVSFLEDLPNFYSYTSFYVWWSSSFLIIAGNLGLQSKM